MSKLFWRTIAAVAIALFTIPAFAANEKDYTYLALGDSVAFGFDPTEKKFTPSKFVGYPDRVAISLKNTNGKDLVNAACPGQSSGSFLAGGFASPDLGCEYYKTTYGLHTDYLCRTQVSFAISELARNRAINLVTLSIGGNDLALLQNACANSNFDIFAACVGAGITGVLQNYGQNLTGILIALRSTGYTGKIVLLKYYSPNSSLVFRGAVTALNDVMAFVGTQLGFGALIADGFTAFDDASVSSRGDACVAGLLVRLTKTSCDIHPSDKGHKVLADAVMAAH